MEREEEPRRSGAAADRPDEHGAGPTRARPLTSAELVHELGNRLTVAQLNLALAREELQSWQARGAPPDDWLKSLERILEEQREAEIALGQWSTLVRELRRERSFR